MEKKVYLRIGTPRSMKDPIARRMVINLVLCTLGLAAVMVMSYVKETETANILAVFAAVWFVTGAIPVSLIIFNSYAYIQDGELVCNKLGFYEQHYAFSVLEKVELVKSRVVVFSDGKPLVSMPDNEAARELVRQLRVPSEL